MSETRKKLLFISPRFLFPVDSGGKIRTTQILRGMKGGDYEIVLVSPATEEQTSRHRAELDSMCDVFQWWKEAERGRWFHFARMAYIASPLPIPIRTDWNTEAVNLVASLLGERPDVVVFDFLHSVILAPEHLDSPSVLFTHNVESEIFERHRDRAKNGFMRAFWNDQARKMARFESAAVKRFDVVVVVSERDGEMFRERFGRAGSHVIPTGVDLDFFNFMEPDRDDEVVFCGSMDWVANQDAVQFFMDDVWPLVIADAPSTRMKVVGRAPPSWLLERAAKRSLDWTFTGFVDDVRSHIQGSSLSVIPMNIAGGTRLKAYEALAMGSPLVSTSIGIEGLPLEHSQQCLVANDAESFAGEVVRLLRDRDLRCRLARNARRYVEDHFSFHVAAQSFKQACSAAVAGK